MNAAFDDLLKTCQKAKPETLPDTLKTVFTTSHAEGLLDSEREALFMVLKKATGVSLSALRKDWERYIATKEARAKIEQAEAPPPPEVEAKADQLLRTPNLLELAIQTIGLLGVVGEKANRGLLYLALVSRLLAEPISVLVKGRSAGGKSNLVKRVLALMSPDSFYEFTAMSPKALIYSEIDLQHKHLIVYEEDGSEEAEYIIRTLLSEGRISYLAAEKGAKGITTRHIEKEGPTGLITTLTRSRIKEDNETRAWSLYVDDTTEQTLNVVKAIAEAASSGNHRQIDTRPWQVLQRKLEPHEVVLPFASAIAELLKTTSLPADSTRLRRDFTRLLNLIKVITLLYQKQRERTEESEVLATLNDYRMAYELVAAPFAESVSELSPKALKLAKAIHKIHGTEWGLIKVKDLMGHLRWSRPTVHAYLPQVEAAGLATIEGGRPGQTTLITPSGAVPEVHLEMLPKPEELQDFLIQRQGPLKVASVAKDLAGSPIKEPLTHHKPLEELLSGARLEQGELYGLNGPSKIINSVNHAGDSKIVNDHPTVKPTLSRSEAELPSQGWEEV